MKKIISITVQPYPNDGRPSVRFEEGLSLSLARKIHFLLSNLCLGSWEVFVNYSNGTFLRLSV